ncbi:DUF3841 domain-containing protein [Paludicola sp. MB14-C6]|uniref:DUF3841 domain-containing protein n=1 Tax=Paludihabitans sp. MB14-C6 TaxID=3070656 RepID=UPI0027DE17F8|nr:DUF3841 domain-containing protein [Paludicola sp. MB14-C6]WMJ22919.1 DUF3841 domain-containing protein [Paludicola sp. MB14-C6]
MEVILIIIWTIQRLDVLNELEKFGVYNVREENIIWESSDTDALRAYDWICQEMNNRISVPPTGVKYPIWAWYSWEGKRKKSNKRRKGYAERGTPVVLITLDIPDQKVLLSDFDLWHYALNHWYLPTSEEDNANFESQEEMQKEDLIQKSWQHIFDISSKYTEYICTNPNKKWIQATFWELKSDNIISIEKFIAK